MKEYLRIFNPETWDLLGIREREELYAEMKEVASALERGGEKPLSPFAIEFVHLVLVNLAGEIYMSKRSASKPDNPGLYDKTVGGHVVAVHSDDEVLSPDELVGLAERYGEDFDDALIREAREELSIDVVITDEIRFQTKLKETNLSRHAVVRRLGYNPHFISRRITQEGMPWFLRSRVVLYGGVYNGVVTYQKDEVEAHVLLGRSDLDFFLRHDPAILTGDIRQIMLDYGEQIQRIIPL